MRHAMLFVALFILAAAPCISVTMSEIHFDPAGQDNGQEFIEIRLDEHMNLSGFFIVDAAGNDTLVPIRIADGTLAVIVEDTFNISRVADNASIYSAGASIGNGLGNTGDELFLLDLNGTIVANASYDGSVGGEGIPIIFVNGSWTEGTPGGTPGWEEAAASVPVVNATNETNASVNGTNTTGAHNGTANATKDAACAAAFLIVADDTIVESGGRISFGFNFSDGIDGFGITYGVEDLFGDVRKSYRTTANRAAKSYTPKTDVPVDALVIKATLDAPCLDRPRQAEKIIIVTNKDAKKRNEDEEDDAKRQETRKPEQEEQRRNLVLDLVNATLVANQSVPFITTLSIHNDDESHVFTIWSYAYKGSVPYTGDREANREVITMEAGEHRLITLKNTIDAPAASASYKVKIRKDNLKTPYEITKDLLILPKDTASDSSAGEDGKGENDPKAGRTSRPAREDVVDLLLISAGKQNRTLQHDPVPAMAATSVFSSVKARASGLAMPVFLGVLGLCVIVIIWIEPRPTKRNI